MKSQDKVFFPGCYNHRNIEQFGLEMTFKCHLVRPLCSDQGHLQVAQTPSNLALKPLFQGFTTLIINNF